MTDAGPQEVLGSYRGKPVLTTSVAITHAGDGLSESLGIAPEVFDIGQKVYVLLETTVEDHRHRPIKDAPNNLDLLQRLRAGTATIVTEDFARSNLEEQRRLIQEARDRDAGRQSLLAAEELRRAHESGQHAERTMRGCPECEAEEEAVRREEAEHAGGVVPVGGRKAAPRKAAAAKKSAAAKKAGPRK